MNDQCPKCGDWNGFTHVNPRYHEAGEDYERIALNPGDPHPAKEHLDFFCKTCGYRRDWPTQDTETQQ